ncbi:MAG: hypothetical protein ACP5H0_04575 [Caldisericum sp.]|uniref:hypothetical protein n=2 Tax=Caldisericaceae TaxID=693073 RepID=UPI0039FC5B9F
MVEKFTPHRAIRKVKIDRSEIIFVAIYTIILEILFYLLVPKITYFWGNYTKTILNLNYSSIIGTEYFNLYVLDTIGTFPKFSFSFFSLLISTAILFVLLIQRPHMMKYFLIYIDSVIIVSSFYFLIFKQFFPYTLTKLLEMLTYMQASNLILFPIVSALSIIFFKTKIYKKILFITFVVLYAFLVDTVRYIVFVFITKNLSYIFSPLFFFILGPYFDSLYFVSFFSFFVSLSSKDSNGEMFEW